jgi:hypothetical protein
VQRHVQGLGEAARIGDDVDELRQHLRRDGDLVTRGHHARE